MALYGARMAQGLMVIEIRLPLVPSLVLSHYRCIDQSAYCQDALVIDRENRPISSRSCWIALFLRPWPALVAPFAPILDVRVSRR